MSQLPPGRLTLSPSLESADPAAISRLASAGTAAVAQLQRQASALDGLAARLPAGWWQGPASAAYQRTATEHVRRVRVAAALIQELATGLTTLASRLHAAKAAALAACGRGRHVDAAVEEFNARLRAQPPAPLHDPAAVLHAGEAAALTHALQAAADALADAERQARQAWQQARTDFDVLSYASPQLRARMAAAGWDPAASVALNASSTEPSLAHACTVMEELALPRNGMITGPDGRPYDLVVQTTRGSDGRLLVSTEEEPVPLTPDAWRELAVRYGTTAYGRKAGTWEKVAVGLGAGAGMTYPEGSAFQPGLLGLLHFLPWGGAYVPAQPGSGGGDRVKEAPAEPPRGKETGGYWTAPVTGLAGGRRSSTPDAVGLIDGGIAGLLLAGRLDDGRAAAYRIVFEENGIGERRARMQLFRVLAGPGEPPTTFAAGGYVDASGHLAGIPVTGEPIHRRPIITELRR